MKKFLLSFAALMIAAVASAQTDVTFDFTANPWNHGMATSTTDKKPGLFTEMLTTDDVEICFAKATGADPYYYANAGSPQVRVVANNYIKVFAPTGKAITKIVFEADGTYFHLTVTSGTLTEKEWSGNDAMIKFNATGTNRLTKMVVTLEDATSETVIPTAVESEVTIDANNSGDIFTGEAADPFYNTTANNYLEEDMVATYTDGPLTVTYQATTATGTLVSKNRLHYTNTNGSYIWAYSDNMIFETTPDKVITNIKFLNGDKRTLSWNTSNTINGETYTRTDLMNTGWTGSSKKVTVNFAGSTMMQLIEVTISDKPIESSTPTGINNANAEADAAKANVVKKYVDGKQVVIEKNGKKYNVAGAQIK